MSIADNRQARFQYHLEKDLEVGIVLHGSEVKSLRNNSCNLTDSYISVDNGELFLHGCFITRGSSRWDTFEEKRTRKLLAKTKEIAKFWEETRKKGKTIVPLSIYFSESGKVKLKICLATGKSNSDKRETEAKRDWARAKGKLLKEGSKNV